MVISFWSPAGLKELEQKQIERGLLNDIVMVGIFPFPDLKNFKQKIGKYNT
jgi:hypothetical protein